MSNHDDLIFQKYKTKLRKLSLRNQKVSTLAVYGWFDYQRWGII